MDDKNKIPEIDIKLTSYTVKGAEYPLKMTVRNMFYVGFKGKLELIWIWLTSKELRIIHKTFGDYLDAPVTYIREDEPDSNMYCNINAQKELVQHLTDELNELNKDENKN